MAMSVGAGLQLALRRLQFITTFRRDYSIGCRAPAISCRALSAEGFADPKIQRARFGSQMEQESAAVRMCVECGRKRYTKQGETPSPPADEILLLSGTGERSAGGGLNFQSGADRGARDVADLPAACHRELQDRAAERHVVRRYQVVRS